MTSEPSAEFSSAQAQRTLRTRSGKSLRLPLFLPVHQPKSTLVPTEEWNRSFPVEGCIVNAFFLYKDRTTRARFEAGETIANYLKFGGLVMTDSGAFQGFTRQLFLENKTIVRFQEQIQADVVSPLDLVTPPGDNRTIAGRKLESTVKRIREAKATLTKSTLAGVQQGGRFLELRRRSMEALMEIGVEYIAIGSLVPFFNRNHNLQFVSAVLREARSLAGPSLPIHVYGAGDPVELPFLVALGADIFDSSSYGHYAADGWYMTPYGAIQNPTILAGGEFVCACHVCQAAANVSEVFNRQPLLAAHNLWTILDTVGRLRLALAEDRLPAMLQAILDRHTKWFPRSKLAASWSATYA